MSVVFAITGHGFGHAVRQIAIINAFSQLRPDIPIVVRTAVARWLFQRSVRRSVTVQSAELDSGAVQRGSLAVDVPATVDATRAFYADFERRVDEEAAALAAVGARLVAADIPPLSFAAAARLGIPAIGISNFTWDWIYEGYDDNGGLSPTPMDRVRAAYGLAAEGWRLPMYGGFETFSRLRDLPLVARVARQSRAEVRAQVGLPAETPLVLVSLGGYGARGIDVYAAARSLAGLAEVVVTSYDDVTPGDGLHRVDETAMYGRRIRYEDLIAAVDIVASKPGYGIIADCAANGTALMYTARGRFREYDVLVAEMPRMLRAQFIAQDDFLGGRWRDSIAALLGAPPVPVPPSNGAAVAADWLAERVG